MEIDDEVVLDSIDEVAEGAPENEGESPAENRLGGLEPSVERDDEHDGEQGDA